MARVSPLAGRRGGEIVLVRPLLDIPKARLVATLERAGIAFADDASNRDPRFTRRAAARADAGARPRGARRARGLRCWRGGCGAPTRRSRWRSTSPRPRCPSASGPLAARSCSMPKSFAACPPKWRCACSGAPSRITATRAGRARQARGALRARSRARRGRARGPLRLRRTLAGALVTLAAGRLVVERAPPRAIAAGRANLNHGRIWQARRVKRR